MGSGTNGGRLTDSGAGFITAGGTVKKMGLPTKITITGAIAMLIAAVAWQIWQGNITIGPRPAEADLIDVVRSNETVSRRNEVELRAVREVARDNVIKLGKVSDTLVRIETRQEEQAKSVTERLDLMLRLLNKED